MYSAVFIRTNGKLTAFPFDEILFITARNNYSEIVTAKKKYFVYVTLGCLETRLPEYLFCRVHRSHIVAVRQISSFDHQEVEVGGIKLPINKAGFEAILQRVLVISNEADSKLINELETNIPEDREKLNPFRPH